jgi:tyrosyl-tRNA synthetase
MESGEIHDIPEDVWESELEKDHGRLEKREVRIVTDIDWLENKDMWKDLKTIIMRKLALKRLRALNVEKKRYSANLKMMRAMLDNGLLSRTLFGE